MRYFVAVLVSMVIVRLRALDNGFITPPLGWSSWNHFGDISKPRPPHPKQKNFGLCNETCFLQMADAMVSSGMQQAGYSYINVDAGWAHGGGRDASGRLVPNAQLFPSGMKAFGDQLHAKGFGFGLYTGYAPQVCGFMNGSWGHEKIDAQTFAEWGVDYLKNDWCYNRKDKYKADAKHRFALMRDALNATGRKIFYSIHGKSDTWNASNGTVHGWPTYYEDAPAIANTWRVGGDISDNFTSIMQLVDLDTPLGPYAGVGAFNDNDMMEVGMPSLTETENKAHFGMWCLLASPLIAGNDLTAMDAATIAILTNPHAIAVNQDPLVKQASLVSHGEGLTHMVAEVCNPHDESQRGWQWLPTSGQIQYKPTGLCVDASGAKSGSTGFVPLVKCNSSARSQAFSYNNATLKLTSKFSAGQCLNVWKCKGPNVVLYGCGKAKCGKNEAFNFVTGGTLMDGTGHCMAARTVGQKEIQVWAKPLSGGGVAVGLLNRGPRPTNISLSFVDIGIPVGSGVHVYDLWDGAKDLGERTGSFSAEVETHGLGLYLLGQRPGQQ